MKNQYIIFVACITAQTMLAMGELEEVQQFQHHQREEPQHGTQNEEGFQRTYRAQTGEQVGPANPYASKKVVYHRRTPARTEFINIPTPVSSTKPLGQLEAPATNLRPRLQSEATLKVPSSDIMRRGSVGGNIEKLSGVATTASGATALQKPGITPKPEIAVLIPGREPDIQTKIRRRLSSLNEEVASKKSVIESTNKQIIENTNKKISESTNKKIPPEELTKAAKTMEEFKKAEGKFQSKLSDLKSDMEKAGLHSIQELPPKQQSKLQKLETQHQQLVSKHQETQLNTINKLSQLIPPHEPPASHHPPMRKSTTGALAVPGEHSSFSGSRRASTGAMMMKPHNPSAHPNPLHPQFIK